MTTQPAHIAHRERREAVRLFMERRGLDPTLLARWEAHAGGRPEGYPYWFGAESWLAIAAQGEVEVAITGVGAETVDDG